MCTNKIMEGQENATTSERSSKKQEEGSTFDGQSLLRKYRRLLRVEVAVLCVLMVVVWGLLALPVVFYFLPLAVVRTGTMHASTNSIHADRVIMNCMPV